MNNAIKILVSSQSLPKVQADLLVIPAFKSKNPVQDFARDVDQKLKGRLSSLAKLENFQGEAGSQVSLFTKDLLPAREVVLFGLGEYSKWNLDLLRRCAGQMAKACAQANGTSLALVVPMPEASQYRYSASPEELAQALTEGAILGCYRFSKYRKPKTKGKGVQTITLVCADHSLETNVKLGSKRGSVYAWTTRSARDFVNEPPSSLPPALLAQAARDLLKGTGVKVTTYAEKEIQKLGMNAYLAVSRGSGAPAVMIRMEYSPKKKPKHHVVLIGKGVTFDSGGLSIKNAKQMETMKDDMAGAAAVIGTMRGLADLKPDVKVTGLVLSTENMVDAHSVKPGDVVKAFNGKTIEILNTDAEGRLTLADGLSYAATLKPDQVIDIATLTGACLVALGDSISAILSNSKSMAQKIMEAGKRSGETFWEMPLHEDYRDLLKSDIADLKNIGGAYGGTLTAALFLSEFVEGFDWSHLDIAGPAWSDKDSGYLSKGGTGFGVRTLLNYLCTL